MSNVALNINRHVPSRDNEDNTEVILPLIVIITDVFSLNFQLHSGATSL